MVTYLGQGDGTFGPPRDFPVGRLPTGLAIGDFNGDGHLDLAVANPGTPTRPSTTVSILLGRGDGTFQSAPDLTVQDNPTSLAVGDFNGDGIPDLAVANSFSHTVSIRLGVGDGTFAAAPDIAVSGHPTAVTIGDFNGDKLLDLAVASATTNNISILLGAGDGTFRIVRPFGVGRAPRSIVVGDFNGDGRPDLAVANLGHVDSYSVSILINDTADPFAP